MGWVAYPGDIGARRFLQESFDIPVLEFDAAKLLRAAAKEGHFAHASFGHWRAFVNVTSVAGGVASGVVQWCLPYIDWWGLPPGPQRFLTWELEYFYPGNPMLARGLMDDAGHKTEQVNVWRAREFTVRVPSNGRVRWDEACAGALQMEHEAAAVRYYGFLKWLSGLWVWA
jgi:hypothetical protein